MVYFKRLLECTFDLLQNPMQSSADVESKRRNLNGSSEKERRSRKRNRTRSNGAARGSQLHIVLLATWSRTSKLLRMPASKQAWSTGTCEPASPLWDVPRTTEHALLLQAAQTDDNVRLKQERSHFSTLSNFGVLRKMGRSFCSLQKRRQIWKSWRSLRRQQKFVAYPNGKSH